MVLREKLYTAEEFFELAQDIENDERRLELEDRDEMRLFIRENYL
ncbi:MAG: hypothetical protein AAFV93_06335 [Chloroflexota bacterium]